ncbi:hypothetical protein LOTGIDRAFT_230983 [Lottia gigantea]|uniref:C-type lectin domain-containing protein n=1 Tax=Lottia gigantea TaxID=225164 RepID=V4A7U1_LOTGI|nr:hypothetical protein LOTGIDRAFT_230983 [Lottia gigantea]ESP00029.1 hypothetical protein LOTGIDRAFT_230983 [Lottia gigantea]
MVEVMNAIIPWIVWVYAVSQAHSATPDRDVRYLYFTGGDATDWYDAKENCAKINGRMAKDIIITDWDLRLKSLNPFLDNLYWTGLKKENGEWRWEDGTIIDYQSTQAAPLRPENSANIPHECALWSPLEPFWIPSDCSDIQPYICELRAEADEADFRDKFNRSSSTNINETLFFIGQGDLTTKQCQDLCTKFRGNGTDIFETLECWIAEYQIQTNGGTICYAVLSVDQPSTIALQSASSEFQILSRHCLDVEAFINDTCDCRCINITVPVIPATEEEFQEFVEEKRDEAKKELIVEKKNLSAVVRKKISAPDERDSSTGMGYFGIAAISIVLGGLILADVSAMIKDAKLMVDNLRSRFG